MKFWNYNYKPSQKEISGTDVFTHKFYKNIKKGNLSLLGKFFKKNRKKCNIYCISHLLQHKTCQNIVIWNNKLIISQFLKIRNLRWGGKGCWGGGEASCVLWLKVSPQGCKECGFAINWGTRWGKSGNQLEHFSFEMFTEHQVKIKSSLLDIWVWGSGKRSELEI